MRHEDVYRVVGCVPRGTVVTYGQVAGMLGMPGAARQVGYALAALPSEAPVPWHRVVNAQGAVSLRRGGGPVTQRLRLEREGVRFGPGGRIDLAAYRWAGDGMD